MQNTDPVFIQHQQLIAERDRLTQAAAIHESQGELGERNHCADMVDRLQPKISRAESLLHASERLKNAREALANVTADNAAQNAERRELETTAATLKSRHAALENKLAIAQDEAAVSLANGQPLDPPAWLASDSFEAASITRALAGIESRIKSIDSECETFTRRLESARINFFHATAAEAEAEAIRALAPARAAILQAIVTRARAHPGAPLLWEVDFPPDEINAAREGLQVELLAL